MAWQWLLTGFGEVSPTTGAKGYVQADSPVANSLPSYAPEVTFNLRYPGQQWDEETQLSYNVNRYYGPQEGRYIQADPIGLDGGWNRFAYVEGNPLSGFDPLGLAACLVVFPDMPIDTGLGFSSTSLKHSGILTYDRQGKTEYHEYGRYPSSQALGVSLSAEDGNVRQVNIPDIKIGKDGLPVPATWDVLTKSLETKAGKGTRANLTCDANADEKKIRDYIKTIANDANRPRYSWKPWNSNQCHDFARRAFNSGK